MSDADKSLNVHVSTTADAGPAKEVKNVLDEVASKTRKGAGETEEGAKKIRLFNLEIGEQRKLLREVGEQFPLLKYAVEAFLNPFVVAITLGIAGFSKLNEVLGEFNKKLDEAGEKAAERIFLPGIVAKREKLAELRNEMARYREDLAHLISDEERLATALKNQADYRQAVEQAVAKNLSAQDAHAKALIDADINLSPEQKEIRKAAIDTRAADSAEEAARRERANKLKDAQDELALRRGREEELSIGLSNADAAHRTDQGQRTEKSKTADALERQQDDFDAKAKAKQKVIDDFARAGVSNANKDRLPPELRAGFEKADQELTDAVKAAAANKARVKKLREEAGAEDKTSGPLDRAKEDQKANTKRIAELETEIAQLKKTNAVNDESGKFTNQTGGQDNILKFLNQFPGLDFGGANASQIAEVMRLQEKVRNHEALTKTEQQEMRAWQEFYRTHQTNQDNLFKFLNTIMSTLVSADKKMDAMTRRIDNLKLNHPQ